MRTYLLLAAVIGIDFLLLLTQVGGLSIGYNEASILYGEFSPLQSLIKTSLHLFGQNDYALRLPMIGLHLLSVVLLFAFSKHYVDRESDRLWIVLVYVLLPGVTSAALIVDNAGLMISLIFLFAFLHLNYGPYSLLIVPALVWIDPAFAYLFFALVLYGIQQKKYTYIGGGGVALAVSLYWYGIHVGGIPESRFLDVMGVYAAIFSPIVFVYLFYVMYRRLIAKERDLLWMIAISAFLVSLLLSFRQRIEVQTFAPFVMLTLPMAAQMFLKTYRVRLREFRRRYRILFYSAFALLVMNALVVLANPLLYRFFEVPSRHFAYPMHVAKELAGALKKEHVACVDANDERMQLRLRFYGITQCDSPRFMKVSTPGAKKVTISYINEPVFITYVTKVNTR